MALSSTRGCAARLTAAPTVHCFWFLLVYSLSKRQEEPWRLFCTADMRMTLRAGFERRLTQTILHVRFKTEKRKFRQTVLRIEQTPKQTLNFRPVRQKPLQKDTKCSYRDAPRRHLPVRIYRNNEPSASEAPSDEDLAPRSLSADDLTGFPSMGTCCVLKRRGHADKPRPISWPTTRTREPVNLLLQSH